MAPDDSPNADLQTLEIQAKAPGYEQLFLKKDNPNYVKRNFLVNIISGFPSRYNYTPIKDYQISGDLLLVNKYVDEDTSKIGRAHV